MSAKLRRNLLASLLLAATLLAGCEPGAASPSPPLVPSPTETFQTARPTTTPAPSATPAPTTPAPIPTPAATAPGLQLTFVAERLGAYGLYALDVECPEAEDPCLGEPQLLFTWDRRLLSMAWSPDGERIVFESEWDLFVTDEEGKNVIRLPTDPGSAGWPQWSPDGARIAFIFHAVRPGPGYQGLEAPQILVYDLATGQISGMLDNALSPSRIYWLSADQLAYIAALSEVDTVTEQITITRPDGTVLAQLPENPTDYESILDTAFSPDQQQLVLSVTKREAGPAVYDLYLTDVNGGEAVNLTHGAGINLGPVWSPTGDWIAFFSNRSGQYQVYIMQPDGSRLIQVTQGDFESAPPAWRLRP